MRIDRIDVTGIATEHDTNPKDPTITLCGIPLKGVEVIAPATGTARRCFNCRRKTRS